MTLIYALELTILKMSLHTKINVIGRDFQKLDKQTYTLTDAQTD